MNPLNQPAWQRVLLSSWQHRGWLSVLLRPLSWLMWLLLKLRLWLYQFGMLRSVGVHVPVIVVGNVVVGGAGKTPLVACLARHLQQQGWHPGVISRGYGRSSEGCHEVMAASSAQELGDEPVLLARTLELPVFVAPRRIEAAKALLQHHPQTNVLICDDGLQHLALKRDLEICVFDGRGLGNGLLLPAGPLREPWPRQVDWVLRPDSVRNLGGFKIERRLQPLARRGDGTLKKLADFMDAGQPPLMAIAGTANPQSFFNMLRELGLTLSKTLALPDHFDFSGWQAPTDQPYALLCTEKDAVKLWEFHQQAWAVGLEVEVESGFLTELDQRLARIVTPTLSS